MSPLQSPRSLSPQLARPALTFHHACPWPPSSRGRQKSSLGPRCPISQTCVFRPISNYPVNPSYPARLSIPPPDDIASKRSGCDNLCASWLEIMSHSTLSAPVSSYTLRARTAECGQTSIYSRVCRQLRKVTISRIATVKADFVS